MLKLTNISTSYGKVRVLRDCLLYTSDAADDLLCVELGGSRIIKKKNKKQHTVKKSPHHPNDNKWSIIPSHNPASTSTPTS